MTRYITSPYFLTLVLSATACVSTPQPTSTTGAATQDILSSVSNPRQKQLWEERINAGDLPPVDAVDIPSEPLTTRGAAPGERDALIKPNEPTLPENAASAILPVSIPDLDNSYYGAATVELIAPERLRVRTGQGQTLDLLYRSPSRQPLAGVKASDTLNLEIRKPQRFRPVHNYSVALSDDNRRIVLMSLIESGAKPIFYASEFSNIRIRQIDTTSRRHDRKGSQQVVEENSGSNDIPVEVEANGETVVLMPGRILRANDDWSQPLDVIVYSSTAHPAEDAWSDTPPFALNVAIFAAE